MSALLRQGAKRIGGSVLRRTKTEVTSPAVAEERRRLLPSRMNSTEERIAEGKKSLKDLSDQVGPRPDGFNWRTFPYATVTKSVGSICMGVIKATVLLAILSECRVSWLFGKDHPEAKDRA